MVLYTWPGGLGRNLLLTDGRLLVQGPQEVRCQRKWRLQRRSCEQSGRAQRDSWTRVFVLDGAVLS